MKDLIPVTPPDNGLQLLEPMEAAPANASTKFLLHKFVYFLRRLWWIPVVTLVLSLGTAVAIFLITPPVFVSTGRLWETEKLQLPGGAAFTDDRENYLGTQSELLRSQLLREMALARMRATETNSIILGEDGQPLWVDIQTLYSPKSSVYTVVARSVNPAFTPAFLNALMNTYLEYRKNIRREVSVGTLASISEQVQKLERDLKTDQATLDEYERSNNFAVLQQESAVEASYLGRLKTELSDYQLQMRMLGAMEPDTDPAHPSATNASEAVLESLSGASAAGSRNEAARQIEILKLDRERLSKYLRPQHPKIVKLDEEIARSQKLIDLYHRQSQQQIETARETLQLKIDNTEKFIRQWEDKVSDANARIAAANVLRQNVARNQTMYDRLTALLQNVDISRNIDQETLAILEPATMATRSYREARAKIAQGAILGLGLGLGIVFLFAWRDDRFATLAEVTDKFGESVVGQVPDMPELDAGQPSLALLQGDDGRHMFAESYRNLRSALMYLAVDGKRPRVLLVTSAVPNEGKSTVATNLARTMALGGSRVLLVDGDLRRGHIHTRLNLPSKPGLGELLQNAGDMNAFVRATDLENLSFIARGTTSLHPGDLFLSAAFDQFLAAARRQYDYVVLDTSPVFAADESSSIAPKMDGTLLVVRSRFSNAREVKDALNILFQRQARVLGLILNRADTASRSYYAYRYPEYHSTAEKAEADGPAGT